MEGARRRGKAIAERIDGSGSGRQRCLPGATKNAIEQARCGVSLMGTSAHHEDRQENKQGLRPNAAAGEHIAQNRTKLEGERNYCSDQPIER
jgi:hypothetical protein